MKKAYWISGLTLVVLGAIAFAVVHQQRERIFAQATEQEKQQVEAWVQETARVQNLAAVFLLTDTGTQHAAFLRYWSALQTPDYIRVKAWSEDFRVLWSDTRELIGERFPDNHELEESLKGEIELEFDQSATAENESERHLKDLVEVYVPIYDGDRIVGVIEVYKSSRVSEAADRQFQALAVAVGGGAFLLWGVVSLILYRREKRNREVK